MLCFYHCAKEHDMLLQHRNREKQAVGANDYLSGQQLCDCTLHSFDPTIRCGEQRRGEWGMTERQKEYSILYHCLQKRGCGYPA